MFPGDFPENLEASSEFFIECEDRSKISAAVAVIGSTPNGNEILGGIVELVAFLNELMCSADEFELVDVVKLSCDSRSKKPSSPSRTDSPGLNIFRITPHEITENALMRNLLSTINGTNLINGSNIR